MSEVRGKPTCGCRGCAAAYKEALHHVSEMLEELGPVYQWKTVVMDDGYSSLVSKEMPVAEMVRSMK